MSDAVILQFRRPVDLQPALGLDVQPPTELLFPCTPGPPVLFPAELWPSEPAVSSQCGRSCSPDDCDAPRCYQR